MHIASNHRRHLKFLALGLALMLAALACTIELRPLSSFPTVDADATDETKALFIKLWTVGKSNLTLFGHQDDLLYGVGWRDVPGRSDVLDASGSYPAVYGFELGGLELGGTNNLDGVPFNSIRDRIIDGYLRGGVITISWHMSNPVTRGNAWDMTPAVSTILPGGSNHALYRGWLDRFAQFDRTLTVPSAPWNQNQHLVPVIFRPFHEHNFSAFWWGGQNTNEADYIALWRFIVEYLRDTAGLHNLLYAISPDARGMRDRNSDYSYRDLASFQTQYFYAYPGDSYVDVLGLDDYADVEVNQLIGYKSGLEMLVQTAQGRSDLKIPALTETGGQRWPDDDWWTTFLYPALTGTRIWHGQVAWALVWRNADATRAGHSAPYLGDSSAADFIVFKNRRPIVFQDENPFTMYTWP